MDSISILILAVKWRDNDEIVLDEIEMQFENVIINLQSNSGRMTEHKLYQH